MTTKRCAICKDNKSLLKFNKNIKKKDGLQSACKSCSAKRSSAYYKRKTEHHKKVTKEQKRLLRIRNGQFVWDYLLTHSCVDCGNTNPIVLEFDHVRSNKIAAISTCVGNMFSLQKLKEEISKCEIRCANCHRIKTANQLGWYANIDMGSKLNGEQMAFNH